MKALRFGICAAFGISVLCIAGAAGAQENLDQGKSPAQLFASNCAICHKSPQGLAKAGGLFGLDSFLREHYTASKESAGALAAYLRSMEPAATPGRATKRTAKGDEKAKADEKKKSGAKSGDQKGSEKKPEEKAAEPKSSESKPAEAKPSDSRPADIVAPEPKSGETKQSAPAAGETKPAEGGKSGKSD
jgi:hypothetical protein